MLSCRDEHKHRNTWFSHHLVTWGRIRKGHPIVCRRNLNNIVNLDLAHFSLQLEIFTHINIYIYIYEALAFPENFGKKTTTSWTLCFWIKIHVSQFFQERISRPRLRIPYWRTMSLWAPHQNASAPHQTSKEMKTSCLESHTSNEFKLDLVQPEFLFTLSTLQLQCVCWGYPMMLRSKTARTLPENQPVQKFPPHTPQKVQVDQTLLVYRES